MTGGAERLAICYMVPGHNLLSSAGPTRNVLSLAEALSRSADVTVAFRKNLEPATRRGFRIAEIEPGTGGDSAVDDAAVRGVGYGEFLSYLGSVRRFVDENLHAYDVVLEKSWLFSGYVCARCRHRGKPAILVENYIPTLREPVRGAGDVIRYARHGIARFLAGRYVRQASLVIAETEELKRALAEQWRVSGRSIEVVGLGVDRRLFHPSDQADARRELGLSPEATILLYAGVFDRTHNMMPILQALGERRRPPVEVHIVGNGRLRNEYEQAARVSSDPVLFHGRVPHRVMPRYIAAADLCLAPYDPRAFPGERVAYSTLKIPEFLSCGRAVASVPSGNILRLIEPGVTGFLFENEVGNWVEFLRALPSRERLAEMGEAAAASKALRNWEETASGYLSACERVVSAWDMKRQKDERL